METVDTHHVTQVLLNFQKLLVYRSAVVAQLGERQTEDLKVPGSIPGDGKFFSFFVLKTLEPKRGQGGIEPPTSRTLSVNHTTRPLPLTIT